MNTAMLLLFAVTVLPLVCTPGPDILFVISQALIGGQKGAARANAGVVSGYAAHAAVAAMGLAAAVAASPVLFDLLRWTGIAYLAYLAIQMFRSAMRPTASNPNFSRQQASFFKGFLTSFLNPKGLLVYFAILPNFMSPHDGIAFQALILSAVFIALCALVYSIVGAFVAAMGRSAATNDRTRRAGEATAGAMLLFAAFRMGTR